MPRGTVITPKEGAALFHSFDRSLPPAAGWPPPCAR